MEAMDHLKRLLERYPALVELKIGISESYELMKKATKTEESCWSAGMEGVQRILIILSES